MRIGRVIRLSLFTVAVVAVGYLGVCGVAWNMNTTVDRGCLDTWGPQTPANFVGAWNKQDGPFLDAAPYRFDAQDVSIDSLTPGITLRAWFAPPPNGGDRVVIVIHGMGSCRRDPTSLLPAGMLVRHGFGVLMPDLRNHGESTRQDGHWAGGIDEWQDVIGAWNWLRAKGYAADRIGLFGESMGAGSVSLAMGHEPAAAAVFLDSGFADIFSATTFFAESTGKPGWLVPGVLLMGTLISGDNFFSPGPAALFRSSLNGRPVFIVHGTADATISVEQAPLLAAAATAGGYPVTPWIVQGARHIEAAFTHTAEYERRLNAFFDGALGQ
jgi:alpha-beta hydrolase superfamily lysophospholipase